MKKKGFTLIELLAVIVLLAIITVIAIPKILDVIEEAEKKAYESSVKLMAHQVKMQYELEYSKEIPEQGITYAFGINGKETYQTNIDEVGELKVKGDKPSSGTITLTQNKRIIINDLVSKNKKWCAKKELNGNVIVGKSKDLNCIINEEEIIVDKKACSLEKEIINEKEYYYIDSESDLYELSKEVNSGTSFEGKIVKLRNNLNMENVKNTCGEEEFNPIGTSTNQFKGTFEGSAKTISNLSINRTNMDYVGLFGYNSGVIKGINIKNINIEGKSQVGGLVGYNKGKVNEIIFEGKITGTGVVGGIAGTNAETVSNIVIKNIELPSGRMAGGVVATGGTVSNVVIEKGTINGSSATGSGSAANIYYTDLVTIKYNKQGELLDSNALNNINAYESVIDTYIGGDNDKSGYYFDYNNKDELVIKTIEKDPINFKLKGSGTEKNPYLIGSYEDWKMATIKANQEGIVFKITKDIDFTNKKFYMLGSNQNQFSGHLIGDGHTLKGIETKGGSYQGIIGYFKAGIIEGLTLENEKITNVNQNAGGITGYNSGVIKGINIKNINIEGKNQIGGITGYNKEKVNEVIFDGKVVGTGNVGGIAGTNAGTVSNIVIKNIELPSGSMVGGVVATGGTVSNAVIEKGNISGSTATGLGSVTSIYYTDLVTIKNNKQGELLDSNALNNINAYESVIDTYIGGDNDDSGYYFDYNTKGEIVIKNIEKNPIDFKLKGSGTEKDPYLIGSYEDWKMATIKANQEGIVFKITKDIDFTNKRFYMLGSIQNKFSGILDGDNHELKGIETKGGSYQGIIGYMDSANSIVKNLKISNVSMTNLTNYSGGLVGYLNNGKIEYINAKNISITGDSYIGGIIGNIQNSTGTITASNSESIVITGKNQVGGITGYNKGKVNEIIFEGKITGTGVVGGIAGTNAETVSNIVIKNIELPSGRMAGGVVATGGTVSNVVIEKGTINGSSATGSGSAANIYYTDLVTIKYNKQGVKFSSNYINDLSYYAGKVETSIDGDKNNSGYFFDYDESKNGIYVVKAY